MPSVTLSSLVGGGGAIKLAPDLTFPSSLSSGESYKRVTLNPAGSLTTALSLTGKFVIDALYFTSLTSESITVKLTIDSVVVWNDTFVVPSTSLYLQFGGTTAVITTSSFICDNSLLLEIQTATDNSVNFNYLVRPIL